MLDEIYNRRILELAAAIPRLGRLDAPDATATALAWACPATARAPAKRSVTAAMALHLVDEGKLALDQRLAVTYPSMPAADAITLRMLLSHTSGLSDYVDSTAFNDLA